MNKFFIYLCFILLLAPFAYAEEDSLQSRFEVFVDGISKTVDSFGDDGFDSGPLIDGFIAILPVIGLVVIVFGLMFFVTKISIFKSPDHDRYARMIAFGVALIGLAEQSVYNTILGLSTAFLVLVFMIAIGFIFIMFVNYNRKAHLESYKELHKVTGESLTARRDLEKIKHELKYEKNLRAKTDKDLEALEHDLDNIDHLVGDELSRIDRLAELLRKATASYNNGDGHAVNQYVSALSKDLGSLVTTMQHEQGYDRHLSSLISRVEAELARWSHGIDKDRGEEAHLKSIMKKLAHSWGLDAHDDHMQQLLSGEHELLAKLKNLRNHIHRLQHFFDKLMNDTEELGKSSYERKHLEAHSVRDNILNQQFAEAHKHLDNLRAIVEQEPHIIKQFRNHENELRSLLSMVEEEEKQLNALLSGEFAIKLQKIKADVKEAKSHVDTYYRSLRVVASKAMHDADKYSHMNPNYNNNMSGFTRWAAKFSKILHAIDAKKGDGLALRIQKDELLASLDSYKSSCDAALSGLNQNNGNLTHMLRHSINLIQELIPDLNNL